MRCFEWYYLWNQCSPAINTPQLQLSGLGISGSFSYDDARFAVGYSDARLEEFDIKSGELLTRRRLVYPDFASWVRSTAYSSDGRYLAAPDGTGAILLVDLETGKEESLTEHKANVVALEFSPDSSLLCSGDEGGEVILWNLQSKEPRKVEHEHDAKVYAVAISPDDELLASVDSNGHLIVSRVDTPAVPRTWTTDAFQASYGGDVVFSPDGKLLACATDMYGIDQVMIIDITAAPDEEPTIPVFGRHDDEIRSMVFLPSDAAPILATGSRDNSIKLWNVDSETRIDTLRGHSGFVQDLVVSSDESTLASVGRDSRVRLWNLHQLRPPSTIHLECSCRDIAPLEDAQNLLALGSDGVIRRIDLVSGEVTAEEFGTTRPERMAVSSAGKRMLKVGQQGIESINLETGAAERFPFADGLRHFPDETPVALSIDGTSFVVVSTNGTVYIGDTRHGVRHEIPGQHRAGNNVAFNRTGDRAASAGLDGVVCLWDVETGALVDRLGDGNTGTSSLAFSPDGELLVAGSGDHLIRIWDLNGDNTSPLRLSGHTGPVSFYSPTTRKH